VARSRRPQWRAPPRDRRRGSHGRLRGHTKADEAQRLDDEEQRLDAQHGGTHRIWSIAGSTVEFETTRRSAKRSDSTPKRGVAGRILSIAQGCATLGLAALRIEAIRPHLGQHHRSQRLRPARDEDCEH
jgi:hypothetical protein